MLDIKFIHDNVDLIKDNTKKRNNKVDIDELLKLDDERRKNLQEIEKLRALRNQKSKDKPSEEEIIKMRGVGDKIKTLENKQRQAEEEYKNLLLAVPNLTHPDVPIGNEEAFRVLEKHGEPSKFNFQPKDHETLMTELDLIDFERGAKVTGSKFYFFKNDAVLLNQAMIRYGIDICLKHGYKLLETPDLVRNDVLEGSGFNPRGEETQTYAIQDQDLSLIGTAEITTLGYHKDEILDLSSGPIKYCALSHCFRTEGGAYGKESKGLYRVHQFTKLEMFIFCQPEDSNKLLEELLTIEKEIVNGLDIPYRVIDTPSGELGGPAYRKYDIEAWLPMKDDYGEITSASNCLDYQARRLNIKYKRADDSTDFVHTLNGTAVALSRFPLAFVENHQQKNGFIRIPKIVKKYLGKKIIK